MVCQLIKKYLIILFSFILFAGCPMQDINAWCYRIDVSVGFENGVWALSKMDSKKKISSKKYYCYSRTLISPVLWRIILILSYLVGLVTDLPVPQVVVRSQSLLYNEQPGRQVDLTKGGIIISKDWVLREAKFANLGWITKLLDSESLCKTLCRKQNWVTEKDEIT